VSTLTPASLLRVRPLSVVEHGQDYLIGDAERGTFVVVPPIAVTVIELLRSGRPVAEVSAAAAASCGTDVDVADFAESLCELGLAELAEGPALPAAAPETAAQSGGPARRPWAPLVVGFPAWLLAGLALGGCIAGFAVRPGLWPSASDLFPLASPVLSVIALSVAMCALRGLHELCHWLAARAEGVKARVRVDRRLYVLVFETDLTGLWGLPRRRRYWPLLIGLGFDTVVLAAALALRLAAQAGLWDPAPGLAKMLAAVTLIQIVGIGLQFCVFVRTDIYAVLVAATGCSNLWAVTRLTLRRRIGLARPAHRAELEAAHPRDLAVARWYVWLYAAGTLLAAWFFVTYFVPATVRVVRWVAASVASADPHRGAFWEALGFGLFLLWPELLTLWVAARDLARKRPGISRRAGQAGHSAADLGPGVK
jgi:putative peptide zinc metalloprotease protein